MWWGILYKNATTTTIFLVHVAPDRGVEVCGWPAEIPLAAARRMAVTSCGQIEVTLSMGGNNPVTATSSEKVVVLNNGDDARGSWMES